MTSTEFFNAIVAQIVNPTLALMFAVALLIFVWGAVQFVYNSADDGKRSEGIQHMLWGIIGLVVMLSAYGIVNITLGFFNIAPIEGGTKEDTSFIISTNP